jgi:hypothetical protein
MKEAADPAAFLFGWRRDDHGEEKQRGANRRSSHPGQKRPNVAKAVKPFINPR